MEETVITFETAKLLKDKGINIYSEYRYTDFNGIERLEKNASDIFPYAPTQSLLQKWLREVHKIHIEIIPSEDYTPIRWHFVVYSLYKISEISGNEVPVFGYEEALECGLEMALKLI